MRKKTVIAIDLGASNGRLIRVSTQSGCIVAEEVYRFANEGIVVHDRHYTDILHIYNEILYGLAKAWKEDPHIDSIGIDAWGVDFCLLDENGELINNPYHYRDSQSKGMMKEADVVFGKDMLFTETGVQDMWYNSVFQIMGMMNRKQSSMRKVDKFLMIADMLGYMLTGSMSLEYTATTTTQMYSCKDKEWSSSILRKLQLDQSIFPKVHGTGEVKGYLSSEVCHRIGIKKDIKIPLIATAQHDSASAAYTATSIDETSIFINSGTWSIIGMILNQPIVNRAVYEKELSNEGAAFGKIKLVKTIMGMWLSQELRKSFERRGLCTNYSFLLDEASKAEPFSHMVDVDDSLFVAPIDMQDAFQTYFLQNGQKSDTSQGVLYRTVIESLAFQYRKAIADLEAVTENCCNAIHFLGGAVRDTLFCQFIANATGKKLIAGPIEATAVGNAMIQLEALRAYEKHEKTALLEKSFGIEQYTPQDRELWEKKYIDYKKLLSGKE